MDEKNVQETVETTEEKSVETVAETLTATPVVPLKVKVGNFVYRHRTAIIGIATGTVGFIAGVIAGGKAGFNAGKQAGIESVTPTQIPVNEEVPADIEIPTDVNVEM